MVKFNVTVESQPYIFITVTVWFPLTVYVVEFAVHVYELQATTSTEVFCVGYIDRFNVTVESQPLLEVNTFE